MKKFSVSALSTRRAEPALTKRHRRNVLKHLYNKRIDWTLPNKRTTQDKSHRYLIPDYLLNQTHCACALYCMVCSFLFVFFWCWFCFPQHKKRFSFYLFCVYGVGGRSGRVLCLVRLCVFTKAERKIQLKKGNSCKRTLMKIYWTVDWKCHHRHHDVCMLCSGGMGADTCHTRSLSGGYIGSSTLNIRNHAIFENIFTGRPKENGFLSWWLS